jgi:hypothetical protein
MSQQNKVSIAIKGAITRFEGFGEFIACTKDFSETINIINEIEAIDKAFFQYYKDYPSYYAEVPQILCYSAKINNQGRTILIRAKKGFTNFPDRNRFYERREYYYSASNQFSGIDIYYSLPALKQFEQKEFGKLPYLDVVEKTCEVPFSLFSVLCYQLITNNTIAIKIDLANQEEINEKLLSVICPLAKLYKNKMAFALNVSGDFFLKEKKINIFTTFENRGSELSIIEKIELNDELFEKFCSDLITNGESIAIEKEKYFDDLDIGQLLRIHFLDFKIKYSFNQHNNIPKNLFEETLDFVNQYLIINYRDEELVKDRILRIYKFWHNHGLITTELFNWFWTNYSASFGSPIFLYTDKEISKSFDDFIVRNFSIDFMTLNSQFQELEKIPSHKNPNASISILDELKIASLQTNKDWGIENFNLIKNFITRPEIKNLYTPAFEEITEKFNLKKNHKQLDSHCLFFLIENFSEEMENSFDMVLIQDLGLEALHQIIITNNSLTLHQRPKLKKALFDYINIRRSNLLSSDILYQWLAYFKEIDVSTHNNVVKDLLHQTIHNNFQLSVLTQILKKYSRLFGKEEVLETLNSLLTFADFQTLDKTEAILSIGKLYNIELTIQNISFSKRENNSCYRMLFNYQANLKNKNLITELVNKELGVAGNVSGYSFKTLYEKLSDLREFLTEIDTHAINHQQLLLNAYEFPKGDNRFDCLLWLAYKIQYKKEVLFTKEKSLLYEAIIKPENCIDFRNSEIKRLLSFKRKFFKLSQKYQQFDSAYKMVKIVLDNHFQAHIAPKGFLKKLKYKFRFPNKWVFALWIAFFILAILFLLFYSTVLF